ncbi:transposase [Mycobacterium tuberculosis RGTB423]|nr:transposase [Mycobacterium tuberculosis RGTB423]
MPGRVFASPADFNTQLQAWLVRANHRQHRVLGCRPADRIEADTAAMLTLPPVGPSIGWRTSTRRTRAIITCASTATTTRCIRVAIGRRIEITADLSRVRVWCGGTLVADHDRIWAKHQTISDPEHVVAAKLLRRKRFDIVGPPHHVEVEQRLLTTYDTVLGLDGPVA